MVAKAYTWAYGARLDDHSRRKHKILREYFHQYLMVRCANPAQSKFRLAVVDGFSGGGRYACGAAGSPIIFIEQLQRALAELVQRNRARGVPDEMLKEKEKELIETAAGVAHHRLKTNFILERIAEEEKIEVTREDVDHRIRHEAQHYNVSTDKMRKELEEHDGLNALAEQILLGKVLDFLKANVSVQPVSEEAKK